MAVLFGFLLSWKQRPVVACYFVTRWVLSNWLLTLWQDWIFWKLHSYEMRWERDKGHEHVLLSFILAIYHLPACLPCYLRSMYIYLSRSTINRATSCLSSNGCIHFSFHRATSLDITSGRSDLCDLPSVSNDISRESRVRVGVRHWKYCNTFAFTVLVDIYDPSCGWNCWQLESSWRVALEGLLEDTAIDRAPVRRDISLSTSESMKSRTKDCLPKTKINHRNNARISCIHTQTFRSIHQDSRQGKGGSTERNSINSFPIHSTLTKRYKKKPIFAVIYLLLGYGTRVIKKKPQSQ
jgi:hypothetical protein